MTCRFARVLPIKSDAVRRRLERAGFVPTRGDGHWKMICPWTGGYIKTSFGDKPVDINSLGIWSRTSGLSKNRINMILGL